MALSEEGFYQTGMPAYQPFTQLPLEGWFDSVLRAAHLYKHGPDWSRAGFDILNEPRRSRGKEWLE